MGSFIDVWSLIKYELFPFVKKFFSKQCAIKAMAQLRDEGLVFIVPAIFIFIVPDTQESEILKPSKESLNIALIVMHF